MGENYTRFCRTFAFVVVSSIPKVLAPVGMEASISCGPVCILAGTNMSIILFLIDSDLLARDSLVCASSVGGGGGGRLGMEGAQDGATGMLSATEGSSGRGIGGDVLRFNNAEWVKGRPSFFGLCLATTSEAPSMLSGFEKSSSFSMGDIDRSGTDVCEELATEGKMEVTGEEHVDEVAESSSIGILPSS